MCLKNLLITTIGRIWDFKKKDKNEKNNLISFNGSFF